MAFVQVVIKNGSITAEHLRHMSLAKLYDDTYDFFLVDTNIVPITELQSASLSPSLTTSASLSDPRLRAPLAYAKELQIQIMRRWTHDYIRIVYPLYKQLNIIAAGGQDHNEMRDFIDSVRQACNNAEAIVNAMDNNEDVAYFEFRDLLQDAGGIQIGVSTIMDTPVMTE